MPAALTDTERRILEYMVAYLRRHTYQPSIREIGEEFGIKSTKTVSEFLQALSDKGYLERDPSRSRGVRILGVDLDPDAVSVPCFSDVPTSGDRRVEDLGEPVLTLDRRLAGAEGSYFVRGPAGIEVLGVREGDFLLVDPVQADALTDGDLAVLRVNGNRGFARFLRQGGVAMLKGPEFGDVPLVVEDLSSVPILGRVSALFRRMGTETGAGAETRRSGYEVFPLSP